MKWEHIVVISAFGTFTLAFAVAVIVGRLIPQVGKFLAVAAFIVTAALWAVLAIQEPEGPGGGLDVLFVASLSLVSLVVGIGLVSGAKSNRGVGIGLVAGLLMSALLSLWAFKSAPAFILALLVVASCVSGYAWSARVVRRPGPAPAK